jgi:type VI secretion system secreted protein Hcp
LSAFHCSLEIDGITGESLDSRHRDRIDVLSFSWSETQNVPVQSGLGAGVGKVHVTDLHLVARTGTASPRLMVACASRQAIPAARLTCHLAGTVDAEFLVVTLAGARVTSYQVAGAVDSDALPTDEIALHFADIKIEYRVRRPDGTLGSVVTGEWNVRENRGSDPGR